MKKLLLLLFMFAGLNVFGQLSENFESATFPPTGWASFTNGIGTAEDWKIQNSQPFYIYQGAQSTSVYPEDVPDGTFAEDWLVTPAVTVPANGVLKFYNRKFFPGANFGSNYALKVSSTSQTNIATFTNIQTWDELTLFLNNSVFNEVEVNLSAYAGQTLYFAFVLTTDDGDGWIIDNLNINEVCNVPTALTVSNVGATNATLAWTGPAGVSQWEVEVIPTLGTFTGFGTTVFTNNYVYSPLTEDTTYRYRVRSICPTGISSNWSGSYIFQTNKLGETCTGPIVVGTLPYTTSNNTSNFGDSNDVAQPTACSGTTTNYMAGNDVFYTFTPTFTGNIAINLSPTNVSSSIHVYSQCPFVGMPTASCLGGVANNTANPRNINPFPVTAGTTYYIIISSSAAQQTVGYTLNIQQVFCTQPAALNAINITSSSADLTWTTPTATSWEVSLAPAPYGLPTTAGVTTTMPYLATGLIPGIVYQYYVRANCNDGNFSIWSGPFTFTIPQVAANLNFLDGLETLTGFTLNSGAQSNKWAVGSAVNNGGAKALYITDSNGATNTYNTTAASTVHAYKDFVIPAGTTQLDFTFDWKSVGEVADFLRVWTIPTTTTPVPGTAITALANSRIKVGADLTGVSNFTTQNYTLNAVPYAGTNMRLVFEWTNNTTLGSQPPAAIDNIKLDLVTCAKPNSLVVSSIVYNAAQLTWTNGATEAEWEVLVLPANSAAPSVSTAGTNTMVKPFSILNLTSVTCYDVYVRAVCSASDKSLWSLPVRFCTTPNYCAGDHFYDTGGVAGNYQNNENYPTTICPDTSGDVVTAVFNTFSTEEDFDFLRIYNGSTVSAANLLGTYTGTDLPSTFSSTAADGCLTFVFTSDGFEVSSGFDATIYCTPPITCFKPTALTATNIGSSTATLGWTEVNAATQWEILVLPFGSAVPVFAQTGITTTNPYLVSGLTPSTTYTFYVRAVCAATNKSFWSDGFTFSTKPVNDECINATQAFVNSELACVNSNFGDFKGATPSITTGTCNVNANDVWYKFTATAPTHTIQNEFEGALEATTDLTLYSGTCSNLTIIQCGTTTDVANPTNGANVIEGHVANNLTIGETYYIRVSTSLSTSNSIPFKLCIGSISCTGADPLCVGVPYENSTDVIDFGNFGELGTTPNVKYFFVQATFTGNFNCTITQSSGDVDYAMWGPFDTKQIACNNVPNPTPLSDSYSASAIETFTAPIIAGKYYILMVTNFVNEPGTISFVTNLTPPVCLNADFRYPNPEYCNNDSTNASPSFYNGGSTGLFTSLPSGLSINSATGVIDFVLSLPGTYTVTNTVSPTASPTDDIQHSVQVIVTPLPNATISYTNSPYCKSNNNTQQPTIVGVSGTGAFYSATPSGLFLDSVSGNFTPSLSTPGNYDLVLNVPAQGGCAAYVSPVTRVEILTAPIIPAQVDVNVCNNYVLPALTIGNYFTETGGTGTQLNAGDVITTTQTIYVYATNGQCSSEDPFIVNFNIPTPTFNYLTQPTCAIQTGSIEITSPIGAGNVPTNLFISEVTDANSGELSYVELYNVSGAPVDLSNYRLKMYNNGLAAPTWDEILSGTVANNSTFVIKISNDPSIPGVVHNFLIPRQGVGNNDNFRLTSLTNVVIDNWGRTDGTTFTPLGQPGYTYRRLASATPLPSTTWNAADWTALDPVDYSDLGQYSTSITSYEYSVDGGTYVPTTTFTGLAPGDHTFIVHDLITGCYSAPVTFTINAVPYTTAITDFSYTTPVCITAGNQSPTLAAMFTAGGTYSYVPSVGSTGTMLNLNTATGEITLTGTMAGSYDVTYAFATDLANCINANSSTTTFTVLAEPIADDLEDVTACATYELLPLSAGNNYFTDTNGGGTQLAAGASITTSQTLFVYTQTGTTPNCTDETNFVVTIEPRLTPTFTQIQPLCVGDANVTLPNTSLNGINGTWFPTTVATLNVETVTYTFTPSDTECAIIATMTVKVEQCEIQKGISPNNDGKNDFLQLKANKVEIFNRYGKEVYTKTNYDNDWHGQYMGGGDMPDGTYYYVIELVSGDTKTGWIYINREQ